MKPTSQQLKFEPKLSLRTFGDKDILSMINKTSNKRKS